MRRPLLHQNRRTRDKEVWQRPGWSRICSHSANRNAGGEPQEIGGSQQDPGGFNYYLAIRGGGKARADSKDAPEGVQTPGDTLSGFPTCGDPLTVGATTFE